jgi:hypothetical protein
LATKTAIHAVREPVTCGIIATVTHVWLRTAEAGLSSRDRCFNDPDGNAWILQERPGRA